MTLRLPLSGIKHATIVSAYVPTITNPCEVNDKFFNDLDDAISAAPRTDKLIFLGDYPVESCKITGILFGSMLPNL